MGFAARMIYADYNATTPVDPEVRAAMVRALEAGFGNASSLHTVGQEARRLVERARAQAAKLIGAEADEIVFTSGGTEADNLAVFGVARTAEADQRSIVTSTIEHQAVLAPCEHLRDAGRAVTFLPVNSDGRLDLGALGEAARPGVALISVMLANNETGTLQPLAEVVKAGASCGALVHSDAVQAAGKLPIDVKTLGVALLSFSSHKLHGPKGAGALYVRRGLHLAPLLHGGRQERGLRPGTENVAAVVGFGKACELASARLVADSRRVAALRDHFEQRILARVRGTRINGGDGARLPNTSNIEFGGIDGEAITINLDMLGLAASNGAACSAIDHAPSHVLLAMGQDTSRARSAVRFSFGRDNTDEEIDHAVDLVVQATQLLQKARP
jgi:cysteine desulfurase